MEYSIRALETTRAVLPKSMFTYLLNFDQTINASLYSWYIEGAKEKILIDSSAPAAFLNQHGFMADDVMPIAEHLREKLGLSPDDIDIVIYTHLHLDHIGNAELFKNARNIVQKAELDFAFNPAPFFTGLYPTDTIKDINFEIIEGEKEIMEGVMVVPSPGHTPGCQSVLIDTKMCKLAIPGFCCVQENFDPPEPINQFLPFLIHAVHTDPMQAFNSGLKLKEMADIIIPIHEPEIAKKGSLPQQCNNGLFKTVRPFSRG